MHDNTDITADHSTANFVLTSQYTETSDHQDVHALPLKH